MSALAAAMLAGAIGQSLGGQRGYEQAMGYSEQLPETISPYYQPWIDYGLEAQSSLMPLYMQMIQDPESIIGLMGADVTGQEFQQSPGYDFQYNQAMNASNNAAAAGGMLGSPAHTYGSQQSAAQIANQDYYKYLGQQMKILEQTLGVYKGGVAGLGSTAARGYQSSDAMAGLLAQNLMNQAGLAVQSGGGFSVFDPGSWF